MNNRKDATHLRSAPRPAPASTPMSKKAPNSTPLTVLIPIRNKQGDVVGEKEVVSYAGLLAKAHEEGLESMTTDLVQIPTDLNGAVAIVRAMVVGRRGTFTGIGDADPTNVNRSVARHLIRIAETRAKARALRDYVDIGTVSLEELGGDDELDVDAAENASYPPRAGRPDPTSVVSAVDASGPCSDAQRRLLWRLALALGHEGEAASGFLAQRLAIDGDRAPSKREASKLIDALEAEVRRRGNGSGAHA